MKSCPIPQMERAARIRRGKPKRLHRSKMRTEDECGYELRERGRESLLGTMRRTPDKLCGVWRWFYLLGYLNVCNNFCMGCRHWVLASVKCVKFSACRIGDAVSCTVLYGRLCTANPREPQLQTITSNTHHGEARDRSQSDTQQRRYSKRLHERSDTCHKLH